MTPSQVIGQMIGAMDDELDDRRPTFSADSDVGAVVIIIGFSDLSNTLPKLNDAVNTFKEFFGGDNGLIIASKGNPIKELNQALNQGYHLIFISDQNAGEKGTKNYLFNAPTSTPKGAAIFNVKNNISLLFITIIMNKDYNYSIYSKKLDPIFKNNSNEQKIIDINDAYNKELEDSIIQYPEQYFWFHKKWDKKYYQ